MPETITTNTQQTQTASVAEPKITQTTETKQPDLVTRASAFKIPETKTEISEPEFDFKDIEAIKDPMAKEQALKAYKSFQKGFNSKYQELAETRKTLEQIRNDMSTWTPEKVQALTANPDFIKAAQSIVGNQNQNGRSTDNEYSAMSEAEKQRVAQLENELKNLKNQSYQQIKLQQDEQLKTRYSNYDPNQMDMITSEILAGKAQITREHVWKAYDYENAVKRAYELGKQDKISENTEKVNSMSFAPGVTTATSSEKVVPLQGETDKAFLTRLFLKNAQARTQQK